MAPEESTDEPVCGENAETTGEQQTIPLAEYEALQAKLAELQTRQARQQADFENARRHLRKESEEASLRGVVRFVRPLLSELDAFSLALEAAKPESFADFVQGVQMTRDNILRILAGQGLETIPTEGRFDPAFHEVIAEIPDPAERGTIVQVFRAGYRCQNQVVRAAQVIVSKGPAQPEAEAKA